MSAHDSFGPFGVRFFSLLDSILSLTSPQRNSEEQRLTVLVWNSISLLGPALFAGRLGLHVRVGSEGNEVQMGRFVIEGAAVFVSVSSRFGDVIDDERCRGK